MKETNKDLKVRVLIVTVMFDESCCTYEAISKQGR